jgi:hypothetical protein
MEREHFKLISKKSKGIQAKTLIIIFLSFLCIQFTYATNISVWPYEIRFNYENGSTNDATAILNDYGMPITIPEWKLNDTNEKCCYIAGQTNRKIQVRFDSNCDSMQLLINLNILSGNGIGSICNLFVANYKHLEWITLTLQGTIPNTVDIRNFSWEWEVYAIPFDDAFCAALSNNTTTHSYYTLLGSPQAPMAIPWTSVLDFACDWASGQSTNSSVLYYLSYNLYNSSGLDYDASQSHYDYISYPSQKFEFNLSDFLDEWNKADCQDMSMFLSILSSSIGASLNQTRRIQGSFSTKSIDPVGTTYSWGAITWNFHHVGWLSNIYDPCIRLNSSTPYIPINTDINSPYKADLYNSGIWSPQSAFILGQTDPYWGLPTEIR